MRFNASEGYFILNHIWNERSAVRRSDFSINNDGGKQLLVHFCLKAGPKTDRYRGWLRGTITTVEARTIPETSTVIGSIAVDREGNYALAVNNLEGYSRIDVIDDTEQTLATGAVNEDIPWVGTCA